jgi:transposase
MLTGGQVADCTAGELLLEQMPQASMLHGDKGYDSNAIRRQVEGKGAMPNIPPKANRRWKNCFSPVLYRNRNAIERMLVVSRTSGASPLDTTGWPTTSSPPYASRPPSAIGYESGA